MRAQLPLLVPLLFTMATGCEEKETEPLAYEVSVGSLDLGSARYDQDDMPVAAFSILSHDSRPLYATVTGFSGTGADYLTQDLDNFSEIDEGASIDINVGLITDVLLWDSGSFEASMALQISAEDVTAEWLTEDQSVPISFSLLCDLDGDGADGDTTGGADCDDSQASVGPEIPENCNGIDDDCDGLEDEDDAEDASTWYLDSDDDDYGDHALTTTACEQPDGYVSNDSDCEDGDEDINPGASEDCDLVDNDCDELVDEDDVCE